MNFATILTALLIFGAIIFFHELGHFIAAKRAGITVEEFAVGMGPAILKKEYHGTLYSLRILPVGGFTMMQGEEEDVDLPGSFSSKPLWPRLKVILAGSCFNLIMGYLILVVLTVINGYVGTTVVASFNEGAVSSQGLQLEDQIMRVNGKRVSTSNDIVYELLRDQDGLVDLTIRRDGEKQIIPVQFKLETVEEGISFIDLDFKMWAHPATLTDYLTYPINWGLSIVKQVWGSLIDLITGRYAVNQLSGPVGVVNAIGAATKMGVESVLLMAAFIAINVGVFNLLPFPILDGGKVLLMLIEAVIRRPINAKLIDWTMTGSVVLMIMLMLYVTYNDIFKLIVK